MGFLDNFKGKEYKSQLEALQNEYNKLQAMMTPEMRDVQSIKQEISRLLAQKDEHVHQIDVLNNTIGLKNNEIQLLDTKINQKKQHLVWMDTEEDLVRHIDDLNHTIKAIDMEITEKKQQIVCLDDEILVQEFGLYKPQYDFASALDYKEELVSVRALQKTLIKDKQAVTGAANWTVNGNAAKGRKMISDTQKLLLRAFNCECDELISKVKYTNFDASLNKIYKSAETISKLGTIMDISITNQYLSAKVKELRLAFEYQLKKQQEKEEQKAARAEQREQAKIQKELDEQKKKIEKEQSHYQTAYSKLLKQLEQNPENEDLLSKKDALENQLSDIETSLANIDYRQANIKAGYVYVISNIGAFGENIYKIGMTRRLEPQERVDELGDASVPFNFDVHAMIFSDDAPALEAALHRAFADRKLNMVNQRREFFNVTLDEIKAVVKKNFDKTVEFTDTPDAEQYRISQKMRQEIKDTKKPLQSSSSDIFIDVEYGATTPTAKIHTEEETEDYELEYEYVTLSTSGDENVCPMCDQFDGKIFHFDDAPKLPLCPNCACAYEYHLKIDLPPDAIISNKDDFILPAECTSLFYETQHEIHGEKDINKCIQLCKQQLEKLHEFMEPYLAIKCPAPEDLACRDLLPELYIQLGEWDKAENAIKVCIAAKAYYPDDGSKELADFESYRKRKEKKEIH